MASVTYTSRASLPITYQWKCSECGTINRVSTTIETKTQSISSGKNYNSQYAFVNSSMAQIHMKRELKILYGERGDIDKYRELGLDHACERCGHKEPWAVKNRVDLNNIITKVGIYAACGVFLGVVANVIALFSGEITPSLFVWLGIAALMVVGYYLNKAWNKNEKANREKEISKLPLSSLPILVIDGEPVIDVYSSEKTEQRGENKYTDSPK